MCGIAGFIGDGRTATRLSERALDHLLDAAKSRGPDGVGRFVDAGIAMGMRRLSVIDLEGGWQPLFARDGKVVAFQNGEIYNYRALRTELLALGKELRTKSDTEVIAQGYDAWGIEGLLTRLDGMFAIAILDRDLRKLHLARDRFGEKPLYYAHAPGSAFAYGSSFLQMAALPWVQDTTDVLQLDRYLAMHFMPGDRTLLRQVRRVLPGERIEVDLDTLSYDRCRYWRPTIGVSHDISAVELGEAVDRAVRSRLVADVPVGIFLSGGLDSSMVAAAAARAHPYIDTFSMAFNDPECDESQHARAVAAAIGSRHHEFRFDLGQFLTLLPRVADALDEPIGDQALLPVYWLSREARKHVTVVLSGEGADELFGGYGYYTPFINRRMSSERDLPLIVDHEARLQSGFPILARGRERADMLLPDQEADVDRWEADLQNVLGECHTLLQRAAVADLMTWLPDDLLVKFDRMSMAHSLEGRAPFLEPKLAELALNLPDSRRMHGDQSKVLLREAAKSFGLPADLLQRRKQGFVLPMQHWLGEWFAAHSGPAAFFAAHQAPGLDPQVLTRLVNGDLAQGFPRQRLTFALVMLCTWQKSFERRRRELRSLLVAV